MLEASSLLPEFDDIKTKGTPGRRAAAIRQIGDLFVAGASRFEAQHVELFDGILTGLLFDTEPRVRAELAESLASLTNAPPMLVKQLAGDAEIRIAAPLLRLSPVIDEPTLAEIARIRGQHHLLAISERSTLPETVTDILLRRGERDVVRRVAGNAGAALSVVGYSGLLKRAGDDGMLAMALGQRPDLSEPDLRQLLAASADVVRRKIFQTADATRKTSIAKAMVEMSGQARPQTVRRDFGPAQRAVVALHRAGGLKPEALLRCAGERNYEEAVAILAAISGLPLSTVDHIVIRDKRDSVLVLGRALGLDWPTVRSVLALRLPPGRTLSATDSESLRLNFERLAITTAQRVLQFWKTRPPV
jgi:uncharacterized protein (DUF2336 family)